MKLTSRAVTVKKNQSTLADGETWGIYIGTIQDLSEPVYKYLLGNFPKEEEAKQHAMSLCRLFVALEHKPCSLQDIKPIMPFMFGFAALDSLHKMSLIKKDDTGKYSPND